MLLLFQVDWSHSCMTKHLFHHKYSKIHMIISSTHFIYVFTFLTWTHFPFPLWSVVTIFVLSFFLCTTYLFYQQSPFMIIYISSSASETPFFVTITKIHLVMYTQSYATTPFLNSKSSSSSLINIHHCLSNA